MPTPEQNNINQEAVLARLDERTKSITDSLKSIQESFSSLQNDMKDQNDINNKKFNHLEFTVEKKLRENEERIEKKLDKFDEIYLKKDKFTPVERLVYGITGIILTGSVLALLSLVLKPVVN